MIVNVLSTVALILSLGGQFLLSKKTKVVFPIWIASNVCWIAVNILGTPNIQQILMYVVYTAMNLYSWYSWRKDEKKSSIQEKDIHIIANEKDAVEKDKKVV